MESNAKLSVELSGEVLLERGRSVIVRGQSGARRLLVIADGRMSPRKVAAELRALADRVEAL